MEIFIAARVPRDDPAQARLGECAAHAVQQAGHTPFLAYAENRRHGLSDPQAFMPFVRDALRRCGLLVLLYDPALRGGLIEAGMAYAWGIPIWLAHAGRGKVSSSALGCAERVFVYIDENDLARQLNQALKEDGTQF